MKKRYWAALGAITFLTLVAEVALLSDYHGHFPGKYILLGFLGCVAMVFVVKSLGKMFLYKDENYYDR